MDPWLPRARAAAAPGAVPAWALGQGQDEVSEAMASMDQAALPQALEQEPPEGARVPSFGLRQAQGTGLVKLLWLCWLVQGKFQQNLQKIFLLCRLLLTSLSFSFLRLGYFWFLVLVFFLTFIFILHLFQQEQISVIQYRSHHSPEHPWGH